jgi:hypothetical protein
MSIPTSTAELIGMKRRKPQQQFAFFRNSQAHDALTRCVVVRAFRRR